MTDANVVAIWNQVHVVSSEFLAIPDHCCVLLKAQPSLPLQKSSRRRKQDDLNSALVVVWINSTAKTNHGREDVEDGFGFNQSYTPPYAIPLVLLENVELSKFVLREDAFKNSSTIGLDEIQTDSPQAVLVPPWVPKLFKEKRLVFNIWLITIRKKISSQSKKKTIIFPTIEFNDCHQLSVQGPLSIAEAAFKKQLPKPECSHHPLDLNRDRFILCSRVFDYRSSKFRSLLARTLSHSNLSISLSNILKDLPFDLLPNYSIVSLVLGTLHLSFIISSHSVKSAISWIRIPRDMEPSLLFSPIYPKTPIQQLCSNSEQFPPHVLYSFQIILDRFSSSPLLHSQLFDNMMYDDQKTLLMCLQQLSDPNSLTALLSVFSASISDLSHRLFSNIPFFDSIQIHRCPLNCHLSNSRLYRNVFCSRVNSDDRLENIRGNIVKESKTAFVRLGAITPKTLSGELLLSYCKQPLRWNFTGQLELNCGRDLIVLVLDDISDLTIYEWTEVEQIMEAFTNELIEITTCVSDVKYSPVSVLLLGFWDSSASNIPTIPPIVRRFFDRNWVGKKLEGELFGISPGDFQHSERRDIPFPSTLSLDSRVAAWRRDHFAHEAYNMIANIRTKGYTADIEDLIHATPNTLDPRQLRRIALAHKIHLMTVEMSSKRASILENDDSFVMKSLMCLPELSRALSLWSENKAKTSGIEPTAKANNTLFQVPLNEKQLICVQQLEFSVFRVLEEPALFVEAGIYPRPRVLLYGPSGSGKSIIITHLSRLHSNIPIKVVQLLSLYSPYLGQTEAGLRSLFSEMVQTLPAILILEGLECFLNIDQSTEEFKRRLLATLLLCLDAIDTPSDGTVQLLGIIGVSRAPPNKLEQSIVRPGRLDKWIELT